ncbi:hypothetical protein ES703_113308 [subsurface metagenome]
MAICARLTSITRQKNPQAPMNLPSTISQSFNGSEYSSSMVPRSRSPANRRMVIIAVRISRVTAKNSEARKVASG